MKYDLKNLTLDEKLHLLTGKSLWSLETANGKLPELRVCDGPHGVNKIVDNKPQTATAMPNLAAIANSWDVELAYLDGVFPQILFHQIPPVIRTHKVAPNHNATTM